MPKFFVAQTCLNFSPKFLVLKLTEPKTSAPDSTLKYKPHQKLQNFVIIQAIQVPRRMPAQCCTARRALISLPDFAAG